MERWNYSNQAVTVKQEKYVREKNRDESSFEETGVDDRESVATCILPCCGDNCYPEKQRALLGNILESLQSELNDQKTKRRKF